VFYFKLILVAAVAVTLEGFVPIYWDAFKYVDLPLIVTVYFALMRDPIVGMLTGYAVGLGADLGPGAGPVVGIGGFSKTLIGFFVATVAVRFSLEGPLLRVLVLAVSSVVSTGLFIGLSNVMDAGIGDDVAPERFATKIALETAANLIFGVIIFWLFDKLFPDNAPGGAMRVRRRFYD
jgi:rod shape-determining protein MreD